MSLCYGMLYLPDAFVLLSTTGLTTHGTTFLEVIALYCMSFSERFVMLRLVLCVRLEECFEMTLTQRLYKYLFSKRNSSSASVIVIVNFISKQDIAQEDQQGHDLEIRHEMLHGNLLLEAWRKADVWAVLGNNRSHTPTTAKT